MTGQVEGSVMFYKSPEPLNSEAHAGVRIRTADKPYGFAAGEALVPMVISEFAEAVTSYPIVFAQGTRFPMAVTGLAIAGKPDGGNLFIDTAGLYDPQAYIPAFVRRYPFVAASDPDNRNTITALIDMAAENVSRNEGNFLFENGQPTEFTRNIISFLERFESGVLATVDIVKVYSELDLFENQTYDVGIDGAARKPVLAFEALSVEKLANLTAEQLFSLHEIGALAPAYAHVFSLRNFDRVLARATKLGTLF